MNIDQLKQLAAASDSAQRAAAEAVRPAHEKALAAAVELRDELAQAQAEGDERKSLKGIIEAASKDEFSSKAGKDMASIVVGQFAAAVADMPSMPSSVSRNGGEMIARCANATIGYTPDQRRQVFAALVTASLDSGVKTGLVSFPAEWADKPSIEGLRTMGKVMDPEAVAALEAEHVARAAELAEAQRYVDGLTQSEPRLFVLAEGAEPSVTVRNNRGGSTTVQGEKFEPGNNTLDAEQYAAVRNNPSFLAHVESGSLEIVATADLVEEV